ncbi:hypothetical protein GGI07_001018 [Coemansia sp. Benny D115]|nr:hypothetical protein GGI07_001018 [Coemansia sp. Benny D115]
MELNLSEAYEQFISDASRSQNPSSVSASAGYLRRIAAGDSAQRMAERLRRDINDLKNESSIGLTTTRTPFIRRLTNVAIPILPFDYDTAPNEVREMDLMFRPQVTLDTLNTRSQNNRPSLTSRITTFFNAPAAHPKPSQPMVQFQKLKRGQERQNDTPVNASQLQETAVAPKSAMLLAGCAGSGKSHIMKELAVRAMYDNPNVRVVYIANCEEWVDTNRYIQLFDNGGVLDNISEAHQRMVACIGYLIRAIKIAFALDKEIDDLVADIVLQQSLDIASLATTILTRLESVCMKRAASGCQPFKVLFCIDNFNATDPRPPGMDRDNKARADVYEVVKKIFNSTAFYVILANHGNPEFRIGTSDLCTISCRYTDDEGRCMVERLIPEKSQTYGRIEKIDFGDSLLMFVREHSWLNPRDVYELCNYVNATPGRIRDISSLGYSFVRERATIDEFREYFDAEDFSDVQSTIIAKENQTVWDIYFSTYSKSITSQSSRDRWTSNIFNAFVQPPTTSVFGQICNSKVAYYTSPRVANLIYSMYFSTKPYHIDFSKLIVGQAYERYATAYVVALYNLRFNDADALEITKIAELKNMLNSPYSERKSKKIFHMHSNGTEQLSNINGLDFIRIHKMRGNEADQDTTPLVTEPQYQPSFSLDVDQSSIAYTVATPTPTQTHISFENLADITDLEPTELLMGDNIKAEVSVLLMSSIPIVLSTMSQLLLMFPLMAAIGRLGTLALASMNLVAIYAGLFGVAPMSGMAMALDSLCSQAYTAARDRRLLGVYLQRVLVALLMIQLTLYPLWWNSQGIYEWLGVPHEVAKMTGSMLRLYFFGIALMIIFECQKSFLFAQGIRRFVVVAQVVCLPIGWLSIWLFVANPSTSFGFLGAPWVIILVGVGFNLVTLLFIVKVDGYQCWGGWSGLAFTGLRPVFKLGLAGSAIAFFESVAQHMIDLGVLFLDAPSMAAQAILSMMLNGISMAGVRDGKL